MGMRCVGRAAGILQAWKADRRLIALALLADVSPALLYAIAEGRREMTWRTAIRLETATGGELKATALMEGSPHK